MFAVMARAVEAIAAVEVSAADEEAEAIPALRAGARETVAQSHGHQFLALRRAALGVDAPADAVGVRVGVHRQADADLAHVGCATHPLRGLARTIFILPMMATPVAVALVWTMTFHPQLGVLNWLLAQVGLPPSMWIYSTSTVIPTLVMIEVWHWTPLVMLLILGGLASLPIDPYEAAKIDGANGWQAFRHITLPLLMPFIVVALIIRCIDALKAFDTIYVITQGGPGSASETINIFLYLQAFAFYNVGYASAVVVVFFAIILALAALLMWTRQRVKQ
jgi:ABC-type sugar transport system permease subunit